MSTTTASRPATTSAGWAAPHARRRVTPWSGRSRSRSSPARISHTGTSPRWRTSPRGRHRGGHPPRRLHLRGPGEHRAGARSLDDDPDAGGVPDPPQPVQDRSRPSERPRRAPVARHVGRPRVRQQLRRPRPRPGQRAARGRGRTPGGRVPRLLGAHAAVARRKPVGPDLQLYRRFRGASRRHSMCSTGASIAPTSPRPAGRPSASSATARTA